MARSSCCEVEEEMKRNLLRLATATVLCAASVAPQAATMTLTRWTFGNGNAVHASAPAFGGLAGGFSGTVSGAGAPFDGAIDSYCVELVQSFSFNTAYRNYDVIDSSAYFGDAKAAMLGQLLSYANPLVAGAAAGSQDDKSTALQLAIWNTVYDADDTLSGGTFADTSGFAATANAFLVGAKSQLNHLDLWVLQSKTNQPAGSTGHQDQLIWREKVQRVPSQEVPEPASMALVCAALGGLSLSSRRRSARAR
jgi:hypothetical protein